MPLSLNDVAEQDAPRGTASTGNQALFRDRQHTDVAQGGFAHLVVAPNGVALYGWFIVAACFIAQMITSISGVRPVDLCSAASAGVRLDSRADGGRSLVPADRRVSLALSLVAGRSFRREVDDGRRAVFALAFAVFSRIDLLVGYYVSCVLMAMANSLLGLLVVSYSINRSAAAAAPQWACPCSALPRRG